MVKVMGKTDILNSGQMRLAGCLMLAAALIAGCKSDGVSVKPALEITRVPVASLGGPDQMDVIEGRVRNARPGEQIVLYAHSGVWWIQPLANQPYTKIQSDSTWNNLTHLGTEYAAVLVESGYRPASKLVSLPSEGNGIAAVTSVRGRPGAPIATAPIQFSGYNWTARGTVSDHGGEPNHYSPVNVWIDEKGYLHLRMGQRDGRWSCAEVSLNRSLGYGTYNFVVQDSAHLGPSAVLGIFTWDDIKSADLHNELDIELSRWGNPKGKNAQYAVQPFYAPQNLVRFTVPAGVFTHTFRWGPGIVSFKTVGGSPDSEGKTISDHSFTSGIPAPANETIHIDLYGFHHFETSSQQPAEVVIEKFEFVPLGKSN
jgi:hypothetical protein